MRLANRASLALRVFLAAVLCTAVSTVYGQHDRRGERRSVSIAAPAVLPGNSYTREETDGKLSDLDANINARLDSASKAIGAIGTRLTALESQNTASWWAPVIPSALFAGFFTLLFKTIGDRREQKRAAHATAMAFVEKYNDDDWDKTMRRAFDDLDNPDRLKEPEAFRRLVRVGDWFEHIATVWRCNRLDAAYLKREKMQLRASEFWIKLEDARRNCETDTTNPRSVDIAKLQKEFWKNLQWLAANVA